MLILSAIAALAISGDKSPQEKYIERYSAIAVSEMERTGVPACITLAQGLLESGAGTSSLARKSNNHFGIKCHGWTGRSVKHTDDAPNECFRAYDSPEESFRDHSDFLRYYDRYKFLFSYDPDDYKAWSYGLKKAGYASSPTYPQALIDYIEKYDLLRFNHSAVTEEIPLPPLQMEEAEEVICPEPGKKDPSAPDEIVTIALSRCIYKKNGVRFVYALFGDSFKSIAGDMNIPASSLMRFNDVPRESWSTAREESLAPGSMVYIENKKVRTERGLEKYIVGEDGESLRDICQRFGVRMKSVIERNGLTEDYRPEEGDTILLR